MEFTRETIVYPDYTVTYEGNTVNYELLYDDVDFSYEELGCENGSCYIAQLPVFDDDIPF